MRKLLLMVILFLNTFLVQGFSFTAQSNEINITILDRENQAATQITDGDTIRIQITLPQSVAAQETITFTLGDKSLPAGSCVITSGKNSCATDSFASLGWHWDPDGIAQNTRLVQARNTNGDVVGQSNSIDVSPRPVVLVHGFVSDWRTWSSYLQPNGFLELLDLKGFAVGDGQVPGVMNTGVLTNPVGRTNTIAQNAEILGQYISNVKKQTGAEMVDLVVHSMGGMISRYYIDRVMQERDVAQLIMLGSPMGGSDCSVLPAALGFFIPDSIEIRMGIQGFILFFGGHFVVWLFNLATGQFDGGVSVWTYGLVTGLLAVLLIVLYFQHERK